MNWEIEQPKSLTEVAVGRIRAAIISGDLALGEKLSEQMLADRFKISRSPVRDALAVLQSEGMVNVFPKRGSFVFTPVIDEIVDLCEYRAVLESAALRLAIRKNQRALCARLENHIAEMRQAKIENDPAGYSQSDLNFHNAIIECSGNRNLAMAYDRMIGPILALRTHLFTVLLEELDRSLSEHIAILAACRQGDIVGADSMVSTHIGHIHEAYKDSEQGGSKQLGRRN